MSLRMYFAISQPTVDVMFFTISSPIDAAMLHVGLSEQTRERQRHAAETN